MSQVATKMAVAEFIKKLRAGERDFGGCQLPAEADLSGAEGYEALLEYLKGEDLRTAPVIAEGADWRGLKAPGLILPFAKLAGSDLRGARLAGADMRRADFSNGDLGGADLSGATFIGSRLQGANLVGARMVGIDLYEANISGADLQGADISQGKLLRLALKEANLEDATLTGVDFYRADLRGVRALSAAHDLATAHFHQTAVTSTELGIIRDAISNSSLFDIRPE